MKQKIKFKLTEIGIIPEEWEVKKINKITEQIFSGGTPNTKSPEYWKGYIPWLSSGETKNRFISKTERKITEYGVQNSSTRLAKKEDIVVASAGQGYTRGQTAFCMIDTYINQSIVALRANKQIMKPLFLFYNLSQRYNELRQLSDAHSSRGSLTTKLLADLSIQIPSLIEQEIISKILFSLDSKIELNLQMNKTLETIGQAIFKHWFVDFEFPNEEGKPYKSNGGEMIDLDIGKIPKEWKKEKLSDLIEICGGGTPSTKIPEYWDGDIFWVSAKDVKDPFILETGRKITKLGLNNSSTKIYPKGTTIITARGTVGALSILGKDMAMNQTCYALKPKKIKDQYLIYLVIKFAIEKLRKRSYGTIFDTITIRTFDEIEIAAPTDNIQKQFNQLIEPLFEKILNNYNQNLILSRIRDSFLPKLMSGEIRIPIEGN